MALILVCGQVFVDYSQGSKLAKDIKKAENRLKDLRNQGRHLNTFLNRGESKKVNYINSNWNSFTSKLKNKIRDLDALEKQLAKSFDRLAGGSRYQKVHKSDVSRDLSTLGNDEAFFEESYKKVKMGNSNIGIIEGQVRSNRGKACSTSDPKLSRKAYDKAKKYYDQIRSVYTPMTDAWKEMKSRMAYSQKRKADLDSICQSWIAAISGYDQARRKLYTEIRELYFDMYFDRGSGKDVDLKILLRELDNYVSNAEMLNRDIQYLAGLHPSSAVLKGFAREAASSTTDIRNKAANFRRLIPPEFRIVGSDISAIPKESKILEKSQYRDLYLKAKRYREWWGSMQLSYRLTQNHGRQAYQTIQDIKGLMRETRNCVDRAIDNEANRTMPKASFYITGLNYNGRTINNGPRNDLTVNFRGNPKWPITARLSAVECPPGVRCPTVEMQFRASGSRGSNSITMPEVLYCTGFYRSNSLRGEVRLIDSAGNETKPSRVVTHCIVQK
jgi:hypothetical protein